MGDRRQQDGSEQTVQSHGQGGEGAALFVELKGAGGADAVRRDAHRKTVASRIPEAGTPQQGGAERGPENAGKNHQNRRQRRQAADLFCNAHGDGRGDRLGGQRRLDDGTGAERTGNQYGADDGDYGARLECAGVIQYCYDVHDCFEHCGSFDNSEYEDTELNKSEEHARLFKDESGGVGMFLLNYYLYNMCARNWKVPLRYRIKDMDGYNVVLEEDPAYEPIKVALRRSKELLDNLQAANRNNDLYSEVVVQRMKRIWRSCGQGCGD